MLVENHLVSVASYEQALELFVSLFVFERLLQRILGEVVLPR